jgi:hypothetical protein
MLCCCTPKTKTRKPNLDVFLSFILYTYCHFCLVFVHKFQVFKTSQRHRNNAGVALFLVPGFNCRLFFSYDKNCSCSTLKQH